MFSIWLVFFVALSVQGIKLPGACPKDVPSSMECNISPDPSRDLTIVVGVAFSDDHPSNFFRHFNYTRFLNFLRFSCPKGALTFILERKSHLAVYSKEISKQNGFRTMRSTVFVNSLVCHPPINDIVHMWLEEGVMILWSCKDNTKEEPRQHDEAVLIVVENQFPRPDKYDEFTRRLQSVSEKYLSAALMERIPWWQSPTHRATNITRLAEINTKCSESTPVGFKEFYMSIGGSVVIFIFLFLVCYRNTLRHKLSTRNCQIHPMT